MSKELEAFRCIKQDLDYFQPKDLVCTNRKEQYDIIETALKALDIIKENLNIDEILLAIKGVCKASDYDLVKEVLE